MPSKEQHFTYPALPLDKGKYRSTEKGVQYLSGEQTGFYVPDVGKFVSTARGDNAQAKLEAGVLGEKTERRVIFPPPDHLEVYFHITDQCNFAGCTGCATHIDQMNQLFAKPMPREQLEHYLEQILHAALHNGFRKLKIKYAGGEPLTPKGVELIEHAQRHLQQLNEDRQLLIRVHPLAIDQVVLTNGKTLRFHATMLARHGLRANVSFWGDDQGNDAARGGKGHSFSKIQEGVVACDDLNVPVSLTFVLTADNWDQLPRFLRMAWDKTHPAYIGNQNATITPRPVHISLHRSQSKDEHLASLTAGAHEKYVAGLRASFAEILTMMDEGIDIPDLAHFVDYLNPDLTYPVVCGSGLNYLAVSPRGIAPCHELEMALVDDASGQDLLTQANATGPNAEIASPDLTGLSPEEQALELFLRYHGATGCPRQRQFEHGDLHQPAAIMDGVFREIAQEYLSLVFLQRAHSAR